ncbi:MAG: class II aldolase/adducin family protein, partial [Demequina sp.]|uniref:class II aldolase/adducin family protein n=1 Tax=Demequina sp. TaxID=2050685 RepID=UPI003A8ACD41
AGNISVFLGWDVELRHHFPHTEQVDLPDPAPHLAGGTVLATGSGRRLRQISTDPLSAIGALRIHADGRTATLHTSPARRFVRLTSELNSHLAVHEDQVASRGIDFQAVVHAQPPHLTYLSHIPAYRTTEAMNRAILRWEPETIVSLSAGIGVLPFFIPGSAQMGAANVEGLREHEIVLWSKHGTMSRSDVSVYRAVDRVEYAETAAKYEYMDIVAGGLAEGLTRAEIAAVGSTFSISSRWLTEG